jgi:hypothetical protein
MGVGGIFKRWGLVGVPWVIGGVPLERIKVVLEQPLSIAHKEMVIKGIFLASPFLSDSSFMV